MFDDRIHELSARWNKVEKRLKQFEILSRKARIPAINELRYAGRQIVDALSKLKADPNSDVSNHITVAQQYIQNADHDVSDGGLDFFDERINGAFSKYGQQSILPHFPKAELMREMIAEAQDLQQNSRNNRQSRDEYYEKIWSHIESLLTLYKKFREQEPLFIYEKLLLERKLLYSQGLNIFFGICTVVSLILTIWTIWADSIKKIVS